LETEKILVVGYQPQYKQAFIALNEEWISTYFKLEEADHKVLNDPDHAFELAKMAVSPRVQGKGAGWLLAQAVVAKAKDLGSRNFYLESNTLLKPAINLYRKLGFKEVQGCGSAYERCNIQMVLNFSK
jgi:ribosomal protein S18 acetylase RimI-like enzyme